MPFWALAIIGLTVASSASAQIGGQLSREMDISPQPAPQSGAVDPVINTSDRQLGQRQTRGEAAPNIKPLSRIQGRIANRIDSRINNRIGATEENQQGSSSTFISAQRRASSVRM